MLCYSRGLSRQRSCCHGDGRVEGAFRSDDGPRIPRACSCVRACVLSFPRFNIMMMKVMMMMEKGNMNFPSANSTRRNNNNTIPPSLLMLMIQILTLLRTLRLRAPHRRKNRRNKTLQPALKQLIRHAHAARMLQRRQRRLDHEFHVQRGPNLMQHGAHVADARVRQQDQFELGRGFEVVQFVLGGAVGEELVGGAAELADHAAEGEDGAEDEFGVVFEFEGAFGGDGEGGFWGGGGGGVVEEGVAGGVAGGGGRGGPALGVDAFGWEELKLEEGMREC